MCTSGHKWVELPCNFGGEEFLAAFTWISVTRRSSYFRSSNAESVLLSCWWKYCKELPTWLSLFTSTPTLPVSDRMKRIIGPLITRARLNTNEEPKLLINCGTSWIIFDVIKFVGRPCLHCSRYLSAWSYCIRAMIRWWGEWHGHYRKRDYRKCFSVQTSKKWLK